MLRRLRVTPAPATRTQTPPAPATRTQTPPAPATRTQTPPAPATRAQTPTAPATRAQTPPAPATRAQTPTVRRQGLRHHRLRRQGLRLRTPPAPATRTQTPPAPATPGDKGSTTGSDTNGSGDHRFRRRGLRRYRFRCEQLPHRNTQRFGDCPNVLEGRISHASLYAGEVSHMDARTVRNFFLRERTQPSEIPDVLSEGCFVSVQLDIDVKPVQTIRP